MAARPALDENIRLVDVDEDIRSEQGFLVLADISGFTAFVTGAELEDGARITGLLLEVVMRRLSPPLEVQELEGDAVFAIGPDQTLPDGQTLPAVLVGAFIAFKELQRRLMGETECTCQACRDIPKLDLKVIAHHGRFVRQIVGGQRRVAGPDVILAHRLLKNPEEADAYLLFTGPALERAGVDPIASGMRRRLASYPHFGDIPCFVADLEPLRRPFSVDAIPVT
jgi:hypothetical protein